MARTLIHPTVDLVLLGLAPWLLALAFNFAPIHLDLTQTWLLVGLISFPHFMGSYYVFYRMGGPWREHRKIAIWLPIALLGGTALASRQPWLLNMIAQVTLVLLFWHYAKQVFGVSLWLGQRNATPPTPKFRELLLFVCLLLGTIGILRTHTTSATFAVFGVYVSPAQIPDPIFQGVRVLGSLAVVGFMLWMVLQRKQAPSFAALLPVLALASWVDPTLGGPKVQALLPVFHGLQYLVFPMRVTWKQLTHANRLRWVAFVGLWIMLFASGYLLFRELPAALVRLDHQIPWQAIILITLNIHHYFVDSVLWRFRTPEVTRRL